MKNSVYNSFRKAVETANSHDTVWWDGHMWLDLTDRQTKDMVALLRVHPCVMREGSNLKLPSGIAIRM